MEKIKLGKSGLLVPPIALGCMRLAGAERKQADAFLTHCGMNSASEGLYFEVPLIMYPQTTEQGGVARRVAEVGAGIYLEDLSTAGIRKAVEEVLCEEKYRDKAGKIAASFRRSGGTRRAVDYILKNF